MLDTQVKKCRFLSAKVAQRLLDCCNDYSVIWDKPIQDFLDPGQACQFSEKCVPQPQATTAWNKSAATGISFAMPLK